MRDSSVYMLVAILVPVLSSFVLPLIGYLSKRARNLFALALICTALVASALLVGPVMREKMITVTFSMPLGFNLIFTADHLSVFMALVSSFVSALIVAYSFDYIDHYENQNEYYLMVVLFLGSMMGICYSANLIVLYLFWELTALASWRLIGFFRKDEYVMRANKAFLITVFGALVMLLGFLVLYQQTGSFDLAVIRDRLTGKTVSTLAALLILAGILSKSATLPFHTWLPDAGVAPSPVTALLHAAVLVKIGVYVYARLFVATMTPEPSFATAVMIIALASAFVSAGAALIDTDIKRIIAYSTVSQIGFILFGFASGTAAGITGAMLYILMHGIAKAGLFLAAGIVEQNTHERNIRKLGGLFNTMPVTSISFFLCSLSVMGIPPFGGFFSKYLVISGAISGGHYAIAAAFLAGGFLTILYLLRLHDTLFLREPDEACSIAREKSPIMVGTVALLAAFSLASGLLVHFPGIFINEAVQSLIGVAR